MKRDVLLFRLSCVMLAISAFSVLLSFAGNYDGNTREVIFAVLTGVLFWGGLIAGIALLFVVNRNRKIYETKKRERKAKRRRVGAVSFLSNKPARVADIAMVALFILTLITMFIPSVSQSATLIAAVFLLFSVYMHCMLNGVNFIYIKSLDEECNK